MRVEVLAIIPSDHGHELALRIGVAVDIPLGGLDGPVAGEQLDIAQRATGLVDEPRRPAEPNWHAHQNHPACAPNDAAGARSA